jgi:hypothetical protein
MSGLLCTGCASMSVRCDKHIVCSDCHTLLSAAFLQLPFHDPLLCLTASITVRERPVPMTPARSELAAMLAAAGGLPQYPTPPRPEPLSDEREEFYHGLDEVNLLEGLSSGTLIFAPCPQLTHPI